MAAKLALKEGKNLIQNQAEKRLQKMISQADIVVDHVGRLKGAAMKSIQMLTIEGQDFLPPEVLQRLEKLQSQAPPLSNELMLDHLKKEIGPDKFKNIKNLSPTPIAAASIGQVYQAEIENQPVVIKVQYPEIAESVDSDIQILKKIVQGWLFVSRKEIDVNELFDEVLRVLKMETNYLKESESIQRYKSLFENEPNYLIPKVYTEYTTSKVLVLSKMQGLEFTQWLHQSPSMEEKEKIGLLLLQLYMKEFFSNRLVQTDPNPANFLINSQNQMVLLDFGATISYSEDFAQRYQELLRTLFLGNKSEVLQKLSDLDFLSSKESIETKEEFIEFLKLSLLPFEKDKQPFDFSEAEYSNTVRQKALEFTKKIQYSAPPKKIIFLHRKLGGIFFLLKKLGIKVDLSAYRDVILSQDSL